MVNKIQPFTPGTRFKSNSEEIYRGAYITVVKEVANIFGTDEPVYEAYMATEKDGEPSNVILIKHSRLTHPCFDRVEDDPKYLYWKEIFDEEIWEM